MDFEAHSPAAGTSSVAGLAFDLLVVNGMLLVYRWAGVLDAPAELAVRQCCSDDDVAVAKGARVCTLERSTIVGKAVYRMIVPVAFAPAATVT